MLPISSSIERANVRIPIEESSARPSELESCPCPPYITGTRAELFRALVDEGVLSTDARLTPDFANSAFPSFTPEERTVFLDQLNQEIKFTSQREKPYFFTILKMLKKLKAPRGSGIYLKDRYLSGSNVLKLLCHDLPKYLARLFEKMGIAHLLPLAQEIFEEHPFIASDGDIHVLVSKKGDIPIEKAEFEELAKSTLRVIPDKVREEFLKNGLSTFQPLNCGYISFFWIHPKESFFEIVLVERKVRDCLFSQDALFIPLLDLIINPKNADLVPGNHQKTGMQPLFDALLGIMKTEHTDAVGGWLRLIRGMIRGKVSFNQGQEKCFYKTFNARISPQVFVHTLQKHVAMHHDHDPVYLFFYLLNTLRFLSSRLNQQDIAKIIRAVPCVDGIGEMHPLLPKIEQAFFKQPIPPDLLFSLLSLICFLYFARGQKMSEDLKLEIGHYERERPVFQLYFPYHKESLCLQFDFLLVEAIDVLNTRGKEYEQELIDFSLMFLSLKSFETGTDTLTEKCNEMGLELDKVEDAFQSLFSSKSPLLRILTFHFYSILPVSPMSRTKSLLNCFMDVWDLYPEERLLLRRMVKNALNLQPKSLHFLSKEKNLISPWVVFLFNKKKALIAINFLMRQRNSQGLVVDQKTSLELFKDLFPLLQKERKFHDAQKNMVLFLAEIACSLVKVGYNIPNILEMVNLLIKIDKREEAKQLLLEYANNISISSERKEYLHIWLNLLKELYQNEEMSSSELILHIQEYVMYLDESSACIAETFSLLFEDFKEKDELTFFTPFLETECLSDTQKYALRLKSFEDAIASKNSHEAIAAFKMIEQHHPKKSNSTLFTKLFVLCLENDNFEEAEKLFMSASCLTGEEKVIYALQWIEKHPNNPSLKELPLFHRCLEHLPELSSDKKNLWDKVLPQVIKCLKNISSSQNLALESLQNPIEQALPSIVKFLYKQEEASQRGADLAHQMQLFGLKCEVDKTFVQFWLQNTLWILNNFEEGFMISHFLLQEASQNHFEKLQSCHPLYLELLYAFISQAITQKADPTWIHCHLEQLAQLSIPDDSKKKFIKIAENAFAYFKLEKKYTWACEQIDFMVSIDSQCERTTLLVDYFLPLLKEVYKQENYVLFVDLLCKSRLLEKWEPGKDALLPCLTHCLNFLFTQKNKEYETEKIILAKRILYEFHKQFPCNLQGKYWSNLIYGLASVDPDNVWETLVFAEKHRVFANDAANRYIVWTFSLQILKRKKDPLLLEIFQDTQKISFLQGIDNYQILAISYLYIGVLSLLPTIRNKNEKHNLLVKIEKSFCEIKEKIILILFPAVAKQLTVEDIEQLIIEGRLLVPLFLIKRGTRIEDLLDCYYKNQVSYLTKDCLFYQSMGTCEVLLIEALLLSSKGQDVSRGFKRLDFFYKNQIHTSTTWNQVYRLIDILSSPKFKESYPTLLDLLNIVNFVHLDELDFGKVMDYLLTNKSDEGVVRCAEVLLRALTNPAFFKQKNAASNSIKTLHRLFELGEEFHVLYSELLLSIDKKKEQFQPKETYIQDQLRICKLMHTTRVVSYENRKQILDQIFLNSHKLIEIQHKSYGQRLNSWICALIITLADLEPGLAITFTMGVWIFWDKLSTSHKKGNPYQISLLDKILEATDPAHPNFLPMIEQVLILMHHMYQQHPNTRKNLLSILQKIELKTAGNLSETMSRLQKTLEAKLRKKRHTADVSTQALTIYNQLGKLFKKRRNENIQEALSLIFSKEQVLYEFSTLHFVYCYEYLFYTLFYIAPHLSTSDIIHNLNTKMFASFSSHPLAVLAIRVHFFNALESLYGEKDHDVFLKEQSKHKFVFCQIVALEKNIDEKYFSDFPVLYYAFLYRLAPYLAFLAKTGCIDQEKEGIPYYLQKLQAFKDSFPENFELKNYELVVLGAWMKFSGIEVTVVLSDDAGIPITEELSDNEIFEKILFSKNT